MTGQVLEMTEEPEDQVRNLTHRVRKNSCRFPPRRRFASGASQCDLSPVRRRRLRSGGVGS
jgi:hypothetical protein